MIRLARSPVFVMIFVSVFLCFVTGCERTVTKYDENGKPYDEKEFDAWGTLGAVILTSIALGAIAAAASSSGDGSYLFNQDKPMLAYAGNKGVVTDASSGLYSSVKTFKIVDAEGRLISTHSIDIDKLMVSRPLVDVRNVQVSCEINKESARRIVQEIAKAGNLRSMPSSIKTDVSFSSDEKGVLRLGAVSIAKEKSLNNRISELTVMSEKGIYNVTASLPEKAESPDAEQGHLSITVSNLN